MQEKSFLDARIFNGYLISMAAKRGRPKKPKAEVRKKPLRILLNEEERKLLDNTAAAASLETSTWARKVLVEAARQDQPGD